jgi:hypothetical protein
LSKGWIGYTIKITTKSGLKPEKVEIASIVYEIFYKAKDVLENLQYIILNGEEGDEAEKLSNYDDEIDMLWMTLTRLVVRKLYTMYPFEHINERSFECPIGLVYAQTMGKSLERLSDKTAPFCKALMRIKKYLPHKLNQKDKESLANLISELKDNIEEVKKHALNLDREMDQEIINKVRGIVGDYIKKVKELEKKILFKDLNSIKEGDKLVNWGRDCALLFDCLKGMARDLYGLFSTRALIRIEELQEKL